MFIKLTIMITPFIFTVWVWPLNCLVPLTKSWLKNIYIFAKKVEYDHIMFTSWFSIHRFPMTSHIRDISGPSPWFRSSKCPKSACTMVNTSTIFGCHNRADDAVKRGFYSIHGPVPVIWTMEGSQTEELSKKRRELWIARINRKNYEPSRFTKVCSDHFVKGTGRLLRITVNMYSFANIVRLYTIYYCSTGCWLGDLMWRIICEWRSLVQ